MPTGSDCTRGTSPRMRGKPGGGEIAWWCLGNIPAYAGKTRQPPPAAPLSAEHPRVCGENGFRRSTALPDGGTSPRMRGKRYPRGVKRLEARNIPAYAGKTSNIIGRRSGAAEHPRVCGENERKKEIMPLDVGTSPRMRGKPLGSLGFIKPDRNIPAYAGKTR